MCNRSCSSNITAAPTVQSVCVQARTNRALARLLATLADGAKQVVVPVQVDVVGRDGLLVPVATEAEGAHGVVERPRTRSQSHDVGSIEG